MFKRILKHLKYLEFKDNYPRFTLGTFIVILVCVALLVTATFSEISIVSFNFPISGSLNIFSEEFKVSSLFSTFRYIPQIPAVLFIGALIGPRFGLIALGLYFVLGIAGIPVFALGGGFNYFENVTFGYILGYFAGLAIVAKLLENKISSISLVLSSIAGVIAIHTVGLIYLSISQLIIHNSLVLIMKWAMLLSATQIVYDVIISFALIALARPVRSILWLAMD